jgi:hypothetical protein
MVSGATFHCELSFINRCLGPGYDDKLEIWQCHPPNDQAYLHGESGNKANKFGPPALAVREVILTWAIARYLRLGHDMLQPFALFRGCLSSL